MKRVVLVGVPDPPATAWSVALRAHGFGVATVATAEEALGLPRAVTVAVDPGGLEGPRVVLPVDTPEDEVVARTARAAAPEVFAVGRWRVDPVARAMRDSAGRAEDLSPLELGLLLALRAAGGAPVDRDALLREVWGYRSGVVSRAVDHLVARLRTRLEDDPARPRWLTSVRGHGYALVSSATPSTPVQRPERMLGRDDTVAHVLAAWARGAPVVSVTGAPGVGTSTVARAAAAALGLAAGDPDDRGTFVDGDGSDARPLLRAGPPLGVVGEVRIVVGPLAPDDARALVHAEARRIGVPLPDDQARALAAVCDGHPLAIALAVERIPVLGAAALVDAVGADPFAILRVPFRQPERHRSLAAALAASAPPADVRETVARVARGAPVDPADRSLGEAVARGLVRREAGDWRVAPLFARACG